VDRGCRRQIVGDKLFFTCHIFLELGKTQDLPSKIWQTLGDALKCSVRLAYLPPANNTFLSANQHPPPTYIQFTNGGLYGDLAGVQGTLYLFGANYTV
jgi:hypothetical protein